MKLLINDIFFKIATNAYLQITPLIMFKMAIHLFTVLANWIKDYYLLPFVVFMLV